MTRLHAGASSAVEVRTRSAPAGPVPDQFCWRGRVYLVLEVLSHWTESGGWWRHAAVAALTSGDAMGAPASDVGATLGTVGMDDRVQQWWRVEAASGRTGSRPALSSAGPGVYDLCFDETTSGWSLTRVQD